jgi:hypothetical protein
MSLHKTHPRAERNAPLLHVSGNLVDENRLASELAFFRRAARPMCFCPPPIAASGLHDGGGERLFLEYPKNLEAFDGIISGLGKLRVLMPWGGFS